MQSAPENDTFFNMREAKKLSIYEGWNRSKKPGKEMVKILENVHGSLGYLPRIK